MKKHIYLSLLSLSLLGAACQPGLVSPTPSTHPSATASASARVLTITSETNDPKLPKILVPGLELKVFAGSGKAGYKNGPTLEAEFKSIGDMAQDDEGNLYVSDFLDSRIRKIMPNGMVLNLAGTGKQVLNGKLGTFDETEFYNLGDISFKAPNQLFVSDPFNQSILYCLNLDSKLSKKFIIKANYPENPFIFEANQLPLVFQPLFIITFYKEDMYVSLISEIWNITYSNQLYRLQRYAGNSNIRPSDSTIDDFNMRFKDGPADDSIFNGIRGMDFDQLGNLYIGDSQNHRIRKVSAETHEVSTLSGYGTPNPDRTMFKDFLGGFQDGDIGKAQFKQPGPLVALDKDSLIIQDSNKEGALRLIRQGQVRTLIQNCPCNLLKDRKKNILYISSSQSLQIYTLDLSFLDKLKPQIINQGTKP